MILRVKNSFGNTIDTEINNGVS